MIPKIIHYIWFGTKPFPDKVKECIKSWKKYLPDYKIMFWNEDTFDIPGSCEFVREAYQMKKYAFVSDYVRLWALREYGGVYLDTDIEIIKAIPDHLFFNKVVMGTDDEGYLTALMMAEPSHPYICRCLDAYHHIKFILGENKLNMEVNNTSLQEQLKYYGYRVLNARQSLAMGIEVFPDDFFHVRSLSTGKLNLTKNSIAIHWHTITWVSPKTRLINYLRINILIPLIGNRLYSTITKKIKHGKTTL